MRWQTTHELIGDPLPGADAVFARALAGAPAAAVITADAEHARLPVLRPGPSPERDAAVDPTGGACMVRRDVSEDPWAAVRTEGRAHVTAVLGRGGGGSAHAGAGAVPGEPSVEVIVPFRDRPDLLARLLPSLDRTAWDRLTVTLVDNGSTDPAMAPLLVGRTVRRDPRPFNFSALNNAAARASGADVLVFLNSDTEVVDPGWIETLLGYATRPGIGAVAPLLVTPAGRVQHAGAAIGIHGTAGHPFAGLRPDTPTAFGTAADGPRNWLAVTAGCLMVERAAFEAVGGFDEAFTIAGQDVDLGLRLAARGLRSVCTPATRLVHDESATRRPDEDLAADVALSRERYEPYLSAGDPYYHPGLTLKRTDCSLA